MKTREFSIEDAKELADLFYSTIRNVNIRDYSLEQVKAWAPDDTSFKDWKDSFNNKHVIVAFDSKKICGFGELESNGYINRFYIKKNELGKGIGKMIYQSLENKALELNIKKLFVEASITARPFFTKMGFINPVEQKVYLRGVEFINYKMNKFL